MPKDYTPAVRRIQTPPTQSRRADDPQALAELEQILTDELAPATPIAALLADLKQRKMLDETLVVWGGEFGRQPTAEYAKGSGRDHNAYGFTMWMAGGGIKGGVSIGKTDELGARAVGNRMHVKRVHATILQQLGLDPNALSYFYGGLDQRLVGVEGAKPIKELIG